MWLNSSVVKIKFKVDCFGDLVIMNFNSGNVLGGILVRFDGCYYDVIYDSG